MDINVQDLPDGWRLIDGRLVKKVNGVFANIHGRRDGYKVRVGKILTSCKPATFDSLEEAVEEAEEQLEEYFIQ